MPQTLTADIAEFRLERARNGGWVVYATKGVFDEGPPMAACADDEALLEWLASQFGLVAPEIEAARPEPYRGCSQVLHSDLEALRKAIEPLHTLVDRLSHVEEGRVLETDTFDLDGQRIHVSLDGLRALVRAADPVVMELPF